MNKHFYKRTVALSPETPSYFFCFVLWWRTSEATPHIHFREFRDASVNMYMCTGEHATTWVPRPKCELYVASSSGLQRALLQGRLVWNKLLRQRWLLKNMWRNVRVHHNQDDAKHQGCGGGGCIYMHLKHSNCLPTAWWPITSRIERYAKLNRSVAKMKGFI